MSTRSDIIVKRADGRFARIYCHHDGYLNGVGRTLLDHYGDADKVASLIELGHVSSLGEEIGEKHDFNFPTKHRWGTPEYERLDRMCNAYGRDRGESNTEAWVFDTLPEAWPSRGTWTEFTYVYIDGVWYVGDPDEDEKSLVRVADALDGKAEVTPAIKVPFAGITMGRHPSQS